MRGLVARFGWVYHLILKGAKMVVIVPLGIAGALALLASLDYSWLSWFLMVLLALYVAAEFFGSLEDFIAYWDSKSSKGDVPRGRRNNRTYRAISKTEASFLRSIERLLNRCPEVPFHGIE